MKQNLFCFFFFYLLDNVDYFYLETHWQEKAKAETEITRKQLITTF